LAQASLLDTIDVVARTPAVRKVLVFEGDARRWRREGFELISQRGTGLGERLAAAFEDVESPALLVGMDTPQLTPPLLRDGMRALAKPDVDTVLGPTLDGGYWSVGFSSRIPGAFAGVPMSCESTWIRQRARLEELGLRSTSSRGCATSTRSRTPARSHARLRARDSHEHSRPFGDQRSTHVRRRTSRGASRRACGSMPDS
jgi:glycosyltransferase A (GT-A) superfamily protein (DUF2064 family)